jgi:hypothetical protein
MGASKKTTWVGTPEKGPSIRASTKKTFRIIGPKELFGLPLATRGLSGRRESRKAASRGAGRQRPWPAGQKSGAGKSPMESRLKIHFEESFWRFIEKNPFGESSNHLACGQAAPFPGTAWPTTKSGERHQKSKNPKFLKMQKFLNNQKYPAKGKFAKLS